MAQVKYFCLRHSVNNSEHNSECNYYYQYEVGTEEELANWPDIFQMFGDITSERDCRLISYEVPEEAAYFNCGEGQQDSFRSTKKLIPMHTLKGLVKLENLAKCLACPECMVAHFETWTDHACTVKDVFTQNFDLCTCEYALNVMYDWVLDGHLLYTLRAVKYYTRCKNAKGREIKVTDSQWFEFVENKNNEIYNNSNPVKLNITYLPKISGYELNKFEREVATSEWKYIKM